MCFGATRAGIPRLQPEIDLISFRRHRVLDHDSVQECVADPQRRSIGTEFDEIGPMRNDGMVRPVGVCGAGAAIGFEVVDAESAPGQMRSLNDEGMR